MSYTKTGTAYYRAQLGLSDKGRAIKVLFVCLEVLPRNHEMDKQDLVQRYTKIRVS